MFSNSILVTEDEKGRKKIKPKQERKKGEKKKNKNQETKKERERAFLEF